MNGWLICIIVLQVANISVAIGKGDKTSAIGGLIGSLALWGMLYMAGIGAII